MYDYEVILIERKGPVLIAKFNRPPQNLMNATMVGEIGDLISTVENDDDVRALVLTGAIDGIFIQHYDVEELVEVGKALEQAQESPPSDDLHPLNLVHNKMEELGKPIIAAINGMATGGGFELALACDFRYMAKTGIVGLPEIQVGILPGGGGTQRLPRLIGIPKAMDLILRGRVVDGEEAERLGMVHRAFDYDKVLDEAVALAQELSAFPAMSVALVKQCIRKGPAMPFNDALRFESESFAKLVSNKEVINLMATYVNETGQTPPVEELP